MMILFPPFQKRKDPYEICFQVSGLSRDCTIPELEFDTEYDLRVCGVTAQQVQKL